VFLLEKGGVLLRTYLSTHEDSNARETNSQLTSASLKGEEDLSGELFRLTLVLSLEREGVLSRTYLSAHKTSNARKTSP